MTLDDTDRSIAAAVLVNPRASWPLVARTLDVPVSTIARRGKQLFHDGTLRVIGNTDVVAAASGFPVLLRIECEQTATASVASSLAVRQEVRTATIAAGSFQCNADIIVSSRQHLAELMMNDLPGIQGIKHISTHVVLRRFTTAHAWDCGVLTAGQVAVLTAARLDVASSTIRDRPAQQITAIDHRIIAALERNGRLTWRQLAKQLNAKERTVQRRALDLMRSGILRTRTMVHPSDIGLHVTATLWLNVEPRTLENVGTALASHPAVTLLVATTGHFNLCGELSTTDNQALYEFMTDYLGTLSGVRQIDVAVEMTTLKRMNILQQS